MPSPIIMMNGCWAGTILGRVKPHPALDPWTLHYLGGPGVVSESRVERRSGQVLRQQVGELQVLDGPVGDLKLAPQVLPTRAFAARSAGLILLDGYDRWPVVVPGREVRRGGVVLGLVGTGHRARP